MTPQREPEAQRRTAKADFLASRGMGVSPGEENPATQLRPVMRGEAGIRPDSHQRGLRGDPDTQDLYGDRAADRRRYQAECAPCLSAVRPDVAEICPNGPLAAGETAGTEGDAGCRFRAVRCGQSADRQPCNRAPRDGTRPATRTIHRRRPIGTAASPRRHAETARRRQAPSWNAMPRPLPTPRRRRTPFPPPPPATRRAG